MRKQPIFLGILLVLSLLFITGGNTATAASPSLLISEVAYDGLGSEADSEFVELYNPTSTAIDLSGWSIADNFATFSLSGTIAGGDFFVIADSGAGFQSTYGVSADLTGSTLALSNSGDEVTLYDDTSSVIDYVAWEGYNAAWTISASTGNSLHRTSTTDTDTQDDFVTEGTNPGDSNYIVGDPTPDTTPPTISITSPSDGATLGGSLTISTSSSDNIGVDSVEIYIDGGLVATSSSYYWDTTTVADGTHSISATAYDAAGNSASDSISVTVDNANYTPPAVGDVKIMAYNVEASGANADWKTVVQEENADIVLFVETGTWDDNNNQLLNQYCNELNTYFTGIGEDPYNCVGTEGVPYSTSGEAIFSRYPIVNTNQIASLTLDDGSTHDPSHDFLDATIDMGGEQVHFIAAHLKCCGGTQTNYDKRIAQQEGIINYMDGLGNVPIIYGGDLNSFSPEDGTNNLGDLEYHPMSMMLENTAFHDMSSSYSTVHTWDDPLTTLKPGQFFPTYGHQSAQYTSRIDFLVANQYFDAANYVDATVGDTATADTGSDHYSTDFTYNFGSSSSDTTAPSQVTGLSASTVSDTQIDLSWDPATDDVGVDHYNIYRDGVVVAQTSTTAYSDTGLAASTSYTYEVSAVDAAGNEGALSTQASATTDPAPAVTDMYVSSITLEKTNVHPKNGKFDVLVQVTIVDEGGNPVQGADVVIDFQVPRGDIIQYVATTDASGVASFVITPPGHSSSGTFTATVVDVTLSGYNYNPSLNVETSDSATFN